METETNLLSPAKAAQELGVSTDTLKRWEADKKIKATRTLGGHRRYSTVEIERVKNGDPVDAPTSSEEVTA